MTSFWQKKSPGSVIVVVLIGLVVVGILGIGGYLVYQNYPSQKEVQTKDKMPPPPSKTTLAPQPTPTIDPLADWLTYTNGITFKYPQEIELKEIKEEKIVNLSLWGPTQKKDTEFFDGISLSFSQPLLIGNLSLSDYTDTKIQEAKEHSKITQPKKIISVNGLSGFTFTTEGLGIFQTTILLSPDKTKVVEITNASADPTNQGFQNTTDKILSTFNFTP